MVAQEQQDQRDHRQRGDGREERRRTPAVLGRQPRHHRQEDQLAGRVAGSQDAADQTAAGDEPAARDRGDERHRHGSGAQPDEQSPAQDQLPRLGHEHGEAASQRDQGQRDGDDPAYAEAVHERGREGRHQAEEHEVERDRGADQSVGPAELLVQRLDQDPRDRAEGRGTHQRHEGDARHHPGPVHPLVAVRGSRGGTSGGSRGRHACQSGRGAPAPASGLVVSERTKSATLSVVTPMLAPWTPSPS